MTALVATTTESPGSRLGDFTPCTSCGELLLGPKTSNYLGLGRIEHIWHCDACGSEFRTAARLAGIIDAATIAAETQAEAGN